MFRLPLAMCGLAAVLCWSSCMAWAQLAQPDGGTIERGSLPARWLSQQAKCMEIPEWEVHEYNKDFYILRQSPCSDFEKPFVFLLFGKEKALLMDTGSRNGNLAPALPDFLDQNPEVSVELSVSDRLVDVIEDGFDLALRIGALPDSSLIARRLSPIRRAVCAKFFA